MTITISASGIALDGPLVAGEKVAVSVSGLALAAEDKPTLALLARFPDALLASVELAESETAGTWTGELDTATKQTALFFATARADERRDAALELVSGRASLARLTVPMSNSALCPKPDGSPFASPVYIPVPGPPGQGGDPYDQNPAMDGTAAPGVAEEYARGDHVHPTDTSRASASDLATVSENATTALNGVNALDRAVQTIGGMIPSTASSSNKLATASDLSGKANDADVVKLTGNQTVAGDKTFTGQVSAADFETSYSFSFQQGKYISAPENSGAALTDADITEDSALHTALLAKADASILATVATTGDYGDLLNKPTIPAAQVNADWNASSGVAQILNKPTIPDVSGKADSTAIAPAFSISSTYAVGDYVTYQGLLYKCTTAVSTAGAWDSTKWTAVAVTDEMGADTPLPFDAEVDYVTVPAGACIATGILAYDASLGFDITFRLPSSPAPGEGSFRCGTWTGSADTSYQLFINTSTELRLVRYASTIAAVSNSPFLGSFATASISGSKLSNGSSSAAITSATAEYTPLEFHIAGLGTASDPIKCVTDIDISAASLSIFNAPIRQFVPVRVGTVGYLYDKVSGRLFGSAVGSIPLVPGPDKETPTITTPGRIVELTPALRYSFASPTPSVSGTSATVACDDRAINDFTVATGITSLTITPPAAVTGRARDFFCRVTLTDSSLPTVTLSGATIDIGATEVAGMTQGVNLLMFTEISSGHWLASRRSAS